MPKQSDAWKGAFGNEYHERNTVVDRLKYWEQIGKCIHTPRTALEIGCGKGENLLALKKIYGDIFTAGVEINELAVQHAMESKAVDCVLYGAAGDIRYDAFSFDLVITRGFLIHQPESVLDFFFDVMATAQKNIVMVEYDAFERKAIEYHGEEGLLWADRYLDRFLERHSDTWYATDVIDDPIDQHATCIILARV